MEKGNFYSYKPYLFYMPPQGKRAFHYLFSAECTYSPTNEVQLELLRKYAESTKKILYYF